MNEIDFTAISRKICNFKTGSKKLIEKEKETFLEIDRLNKEFEVPELKWNSEMIVEKYRDLIKVIETKLDNIRAKVERKEIKISLFGNVSAGKSKVVNILLGAEVFKSAAAHTTTCFTKLRIGEMLRVKTRENDYTCQNLSELSKIIENLGTSMGDNKQMLNTEEWMDVWLTQSVSSNFLKANIVLVDTPGGGNKDKITACLEKQSLDSDIFIFVLTYSFTDEDKKFFAYQSKYSSKPDIFILVNKWDSTDDDGESNTEKSRCFIESDCVKFLKEKTHLDDDSSKQRIFFVSAKEMLNIRLKKLDINELTENQEKRFIDFISFESLISSYTDQPEQNKIRRHAEEIKEMDDQYNELFKTLKNDFNEFRAEKIVEHYRGIIDELNSYMTQIEEAVDNYKENLKNNVFESLGHLYDISDNTDAITARVNKSILDINSGIQNFFEEWNSKFTDFIKDKIEPKACFQKSKKISAPKSSITAIGTGAASNTRTGMVISKISNFSTNMAPILLLATKKLLPGAGLAAIGLGAELIYSLVSTRGISQSNQDWIIKEMESQAGQIEKSLLEIKNYFVQLIEIITNFYGIKAVLFEEYWTAVDEIFIEMSGSH